MAAAVFRALLPASKKPGRASSSSSWIKDKLERASRDESSSWVKLDQASPREVPSLCAPRIPDRRSPREGPSLWASRVPGRASLSSNWTRDKLKRSEGEICSKNGDFDARQQDEKLGAVAYYAGPAFINSPDPSVLAIPFFVKSPDPSEVSFPVMRWCWYRKWKEALCSHCSGLAR